MKKDKKIIMVILGVIVLAAVTLLTIVILNRNKDNNENFVNYETELLGIDFSKYVKKSYGRIHREKGNEDYAYLVFELKDELKDDLVLELTNKMDKYTDRYYNIVSKNPTMVFVEETTKDLEGKEIIDVYHTFLTGKISKSREIFIFSCKDEDNYYLYIYG